MDNQETYIVCIGSAIVDCIIKGFDPTPISAAGYSAKSAMLFPGGEAVNQSVTLSKLGKRPRIVCFAGRDSAANILLETLQQHQVDLSYLLRPEDAGTPVTVMFVDEDGNRRSITNHSHHYNFHPERDLSFLDDAEAVSLCSLFRAPFQEPEVVYRVVSEAKRRGLPVYADTKLPNARRLTLEDLRDSLPMLDCIFPNEAEAAYYTGQTEPEAMADVFLRYGVKNVIVKLGGRGCLLKNSKETLRLPAIPVDTVDATGAGDNFAAGFITMRTEGHSLLEALRFANACGAISTGALGATAALQDRAQVQQLLRKWEDA